MKRLSILCLSLLTAAMVCGCGKTDTAKPETPQAEVVKEEVKQEVQAEEKDESLDEASKKKIAEIMEAIRENDMGYYANFKSKTHVSFLLQYVPGGDIRSYEDKADIDAIFSWENMYIKQHRSWTGNTENEIADTVNYVKDGKLYYSGNPDEADSWYVQDYAADGSMSGEESFIDMVDPEYIEDRDDGGYILGGTTQEQWCSFFMYFLQQYRVQNITDFTMPYKIYVDKDYTLEKLVFELDKPYRNMCNMSDPYDEDWCIKTITIQDYYLEATRVGEEIEIEVPEEVIQNAVKVEY